MSSGGQCWVLAVLLVSGISLVTANPDMAKAAAGDIYFGDVVPATVVLRGSSLETSPSPTNPEGVPVVLRGSPLQRLPSSAAPPACAPGYDYNPGVGCLVPDDAYAADYGYWPFYGFGWFGFDRQRHRFRHGFTHGMTRGMAIRHGRGANHFGQGFAHAGGFGRR